MESNRDLLLHKYKNKVVPREKSIAELIEYLRNKMDIIEIPPSELSQAQYQSVLFTFVHCLRNSKYKLTVDEFDLIIFKILKNKKSIMYYTQKSEENIFVVFEKKAGIIYANNSKLFLELSIEQGISQHDYDGETVLFDYYLSCLDRYDKKEY